MPFDPQLFEAQVALELIPATQLPSIAQDAMEAGFDGPYLVRMAITHPHHLYVIDQLLPSMLTELGLQRIAPREAALRVAVNRAEEMLQSGADPLSANDFFHQVWVAADYPRELCDLGTLDDLPYQGNSEAAQFNFALNALTGILPADSEARRIGQQRLAHLREQKQTLERTRQEHWWKRLFSLRQH